MTDVRRGAPAGDRPTGHPARPDVGEPARARVRRHHRDRAPRPVRRSSGSGLVRRVHGGAVPPARSSLIEAGLARARPGQHREKERIAARRARPAARRPAARSCSTPARTTEPAGHAAPPRPRAHRRHPRACRSPPGWPVSPSIDLHLLPGRVRRTTQAAVGADTVAALADLRVDVAFLGTNGITAEHGLTTPDRDEAAVKRAMVACGAPGRGARRLPQDRRRDRRSGSPPLGEVDVLVTDDGVADRRPPGARRRPASRCRRMTDRMIVTLTANPSIDRTVNLAGPLERGARPARRVGDLAGRRQGRQHLPRLRRRRPARRSPCCPAAKDDPFVLELLAAGIDCRPVEHARRPPRQHHHHRARRHHHQAQQPRPAGHPAAARASSQEALVRRAAQRRLDRAGRLAAARRARPSGTPSWSPPCAAPAPASPSTPATPRSRRWSTRCPTGAPHLMKPNGEELASFTGHRRRRARGRPVGRRRAPPATLVARGVGVGAGDARPARRRPRQRRRRLARRPRRRPPSSAPSVPATPASSATSSGTSPGATPTNDSRSPSPTAARPPGFPARPSPTPGRCGTELVHVTRLDLPSGG